MTRLANPPIITNDIILSILLGSSSLSPTARFGGVGALQSFNTSIHFELHSVYNKEQSVHFPVESHLEHPVEQDVPLVLEVLVVVLEVLVVLELLTQALKEKLTFISTVPLSLPFFYLRGTVTTF